MSAAVALHVWLSVAAVVLCIACAVWLASARNGDADAYVWTERGGYRDLRPAEVLAVLLLISLAWPVSVPWLLTRIRRAP